MKKLAALIITVLVCLVSGCATHTTQDYGFRNINPKRHTLDFFGQDAGDCRTVALEFTENARHSALFLCMRQRGWILGTSGFMFSDLRKPQAQNPQVSEAKKQGAINVPSASQIQGTGTGFYFTQNGLLATNYHVIQGGDAICGR
jgi:S1-C subfamily serine protease